MLVLSRRLNERIVINDNIVITILSIEGDKVKVGIDAPREVAVLREELWLAIKDQDRVAAHLASKKDSPATNKLRQVLAKGSAEPNAKEEKPDHDPTDLPRP